MNAHTIRPPAIEFEPVTYREMSYVLTEADVFNGKNKLGMDVSKVPLNVLLCKGCDEPINHHICPSCEVVFTDGEQFADTIGDPFLTASDWLLRAAEQVRQWRKEDENNGIRW